ncbi:MAG: sporulation initiation factor Spo0A C-terminal domain-containing protein [Oliverpabstia sp.]|nr:sporulation initiation factor Spo0A C-terminal domain-containing protein [Eubacterium sp.]MDY2594061.1 sporulation initiation factor Spo0A C-terminal domain-containing protein [Oliverpabstia sp.]
MNKVKELPLRLGIHRTYKGYHYLVTTLELAATDDHNLLFLSKNIFPIVARKYNTTVYCVERNIRTVIQNCWNSPCREILLEMAPYPLTKIPTVSEFIDLLYWELKSDSQDN